MTEKKQEDIVALSVGEVLFRQGDNGGDLFIIESGEIEIYQLENGKPIVLSQMGKGEVIGVMTCLTSEPRLASARAKTDATIKKIPSRKIASVMENVPDWMHIILKEFTNRLKNMNKQYSEVKIEVERLRKNQANSLYLSTQLAGTVATLGEILARPSGDEKVVYVEDLFTRLEIVLAQPRDLLDRIWAIFCEVGLIHVSIEPEKKSKIIKMSNAKKLPYFVEFVKNYQRGKMKELQSLKLAHKDTRVIIGLTKVAKHQGLDLTKEVSLPVEQLRELLPKITNVKFEIEPVKLAEKMGLAAVTGQNDSAVVKFNPTTLGRTVGCLEAIRRINSLDLSAVKDDGVA